MLRRSTRKRKPTSRPDLTISRSKVPTRQRQPIVTSVSPSATTSVPACMSVPITTNYVPVTTNSVPVVSLGYGMGTSLNPPPVVMPDLSSSNPVVMPDLSSSNPSLINPQSTSTSGNMQSLVQPITDIHIDNFQTQIQQSHAPSILMKMLHAIYNKTSVKKFANLNI